MSAKSEIKNGLLPCPFCGRMAVMQRDVPELPATHHVATLPHTGHFRAVCWGGGCSIRTRWKLSEEAVESEWNSRVGRYMTEKKRDDRNSGSRICYLDILTDHDWLQIECAASGCVSGTSDEWPDLVKAIEKVQNRKLMRQSSEWLRGFCEALVLSR